MNRLLTPAVQCRALTASDVQDKKEVSGWLSSSEAWRDCLGGALLWFTVVTPQSTPHRLLQHRKLQISLLYHGPWLVATNFINNQKHFRHSKINLSLSSTFPVLFKFLGKSLGSSRVRVNHWIVFKFNGVFLACDQTTIHYPGIHPTQRASLN